MFKNAFTGTLAVVVAVVALTSAPTVQAHHSFAMFDNQKQIKLQGTVTDFQWGNPHVYLQMDVVGDTGGHKSWTIECANPGILNRIGWKFNMIKTGDELTVIVAPLRTGEPGALLKEVTLPDGRVFSNGGPAGPALIH
jgi:Family of unknown function (DUF6152)